MLEEMELTKILSIVSRYLNLRFMPMICLKDVKKMLEICPINI